MTASCGCAIARRRCFAARPGTSVITPYGPWCCRTLAGRAIAASRTISDEPSLAAMAERVLAGAPADVRARRPFAWAAASRSKSCAERRARRAARAARHRLPGALRPSAAGEDERAAPLGVLASAREHGMRAMARDSGCSRWCFPRGSRTRRWSTRFSPCSRGGRRSSSRARARRCSPARMRAPCIGAYAGPVVVIVRRGGSREPAGTERGNCRARSEGNVRRDSRRCGHMAPMERPDEVAAALVDWLRLPVARECSRVRTGELILPVPCTPHRHRLLRWCRSLQHYPRKEPIMNHPCPPSVAASCNLGAAAVGARAIHPGARRRSAEDRPHPAADRPVRVDRQADRGRVPALHREERRHRRRPQGRADRQGRHRPRAGDHQAHRAGDGRAGQGERARRLRPDAARARRGAGRDRGQGADDRDGRGHRR